jgi:hypothetical protein
MFSLAFSMAIERTRLPAASRAISSDLRMGTPLRRSVPSTRQNRATAKILKDASHDRNGELEAIPDQTPSLGGDLGFDQQKNAEPDEQNQPTPGTHHVR